MDLTFAALAEHVGGTFGFATTSEPLELTLSAADEDSHGGGSLLFTGPRDPQLAQGTYEVTGPAELAGPLFVVPIRGDEESTTYQAVFS